MKALGRDKRFEDDRKQRGQWVPGLEVGQAREGVAGVLQGPPLWATKTGLGSKDREKPPDSRH